MHDYINEPTNYICPFLKAYNIGDKYTEWQNVKYKLPVANQYVLIYVKEKIIILWLHGLMVQSLINLKAFGSVKINGITINIE